MLENRIIFYFNIKPNHIQLVMQKRKLNIGMTTKGKITKDQDTSYHTILLLGTYAYLLFFAHAYIVYYIIVICYIAVYEVGAYLITQ